MYYFIFYFIYKAKLKDDGESLARYSAGMIVAIALIIHLEFLFILVRYFFDNFYNISISGSPFHKLSGGGSLFYVILSLLLFVLSFKFFNEARIEKITQKFNSSKVFYNTINIIKFILLLLLPLILSIYLSKQISNIPE
jgi:hypothetical protein